ncbi:hypothetical protein, partial [Escherichia coli]|uniref:hypothetical protein n=1 Tax=Escherichia coli TaxID=562 RepID=UPI001BC8D99D
GPKTSIICSPMTSLKTSIKTITYLSDIGCLEIQGASLQHLSGRPHQDTGQSAGYHNDKPPIVLSSDTATIPATEHY